MGQPTHILATFQSQPLRNPHLLRESGTLRHYIGIALYVASSYATSLRVPAAADLEECTVQMVPSVPENQFHPVEPQFRRQTLSQTVDDIVDDTALTGV